MSGEEGGFNAHCLALISVDMPNLMDICEHHAKVIAKKLLAYFFVNMV